MLKLVKTLQGMLVLCFIGVQHCVTNLPGLSKGVQCCKHYNVTDDAIFSELILLCILIFGS